MLNDFLVFSLSISGSFDVLGYGPFEDRFLKEKKREEDEGKKTRGERRQMKKEMLIK